MPPTHTSTFTIRYYECDAYEHLNQANYARLMQETAFEASAAVGYSKQVYEEMGYLWLARETEIEYLQPCFYGDTLEVTTWVADFRQVRSIRQYEFRKAGSDEVVARGRTDWVYLHRESGRISPIPPAMAEAFSGGEKVSPTPRPPFPKAPPPPAGVYTLRKRVEWRDIDSARHLNNAAYLNYVEDCGIQAARHYHWSMERAAQENMAIIARSQRIAYRQPALLDDEIDVHTWLFAVKRISATRHYDIQRASDGALLAQVQTRLAAVDMATGRPQRMPPRYLDDFAPNIAPD